MSCVSCWKSERLPYCFEEENIVNLWTTEITQNSPRWYQRLQDSYREGGVWPYGDDDAIFLHSLLRCVDVARNCFLSLIALFTSYFLLSNNWSHGTKLHEDDGDGYDEALVPRDYQLRGMIRDDDLYELLIKSIPDGVHVVILMDCYHSGISWTCHVCTKDIVRRLRWR